MKWDEEDIHVILASAEVLDQYLLSDQLNWSLPGCPTTLTPGNLLLSSKRIISISPAKRSEQLTQAIFLIDEIKKNRCASWKKKARMEIPIRIRLWKNMISDYLAERRIDLAFSSQVRSRVILELLFLENPSEDIHHDEQLIILDDSLKSLSLNGNFIWDPILEGSFPRNIFWFLYLKIISESL